MSVVTQNATVSVSLLLKGELLANKTLLNRKRLFTIVGSSHATSGFFHIPVFFPEVEKEFVGADF